MRSNNLHKINHYILPTFHFSLLDYRGHSRYESSTRYIYFLNIAKYTLHRFTTKVSRCTRFIQHFRDYLQLEQLVSIC